MATIRNLFLTLCLLILPVNAFAVGTWTYDESTNMVVVIAGTEGTPATFDDFVTADRAGTAELTPEDAPINCGTNLTLTEQVRPVEDLAVQITFTLAGTSAGAGDTLDVTGTDWEGNAQGPESIDVSGGDGAYTGSNKWRTITDIDCTGWADGTLQVTQGSWGVIWDYGNGMFTVSSYLYVGNQSDSTYLTSLNEMIYFTLTSFRVTNNATFQIGELDSTWLAGENGSKIYVSTNNSVNRILVNGSGAFLKIYDSHIVNTTNAQINVDWNNGIVQSYDTVFERNANENTIINVTGSVLVRTTFVGQRYFQVNATLSTPPDSVNAYGTGGLRSYNKSPTLKDLFVKRKTNPTIFNHNAPVMTLVDTDTGGDAWVVEIDRAGDIIHDKLTANIHVVDKNGDNIETANITCNDQFGTSCFDVNTDASGDIAEQTVLNRQWIDTSETLTTYSPHTFVISKAGYRTQTIIYNFSDGKVNWEVELDDGDTVIYDSTIYDSTIY